MKAENRKSNKDDFLAQLPDKKPLKPKYGFVAVKYFLGAGLIGGILILITVTLSALEILNFFWIKVIFLFIGANLLYTGIGYIPLYLFLLRPRRLANLWETLLMEENISPSSLCLDIGCGTGGVSIKVAKALPQAQLIGIDIYEGMSGKTPLTAYYNAKAEGVLAQVEFRHGNMMDLSFEENSFDLVTAGSVLHEIHEDEAKLNAMKEIYRVLKPGGKFISVEILRDSRLLFAVWLFNFVWFTRKFWQGLYKKSIFNQFREKIITRYVNMSFYIAEK